MAGTAYTEEVSKVAQAVQGLDPSAQVAAMSGVVGSPDAATRKIIWIIIIGGLVAVLVLALVGLIYLFKEELDGADTILTVFTTVLAGLLGLFANSPVKSGTGAN